MRGLAAGEAREEDPRRTRSSRVGVSDPVERSHRGDSATAPRDEADTHNASTDPPENDGRDRRMARVQDVHRTRARVAHAYATTPSSPAPSSRQHGNTVTMACAARGAVDRATTSPGFSGRNSAPIEQLIAPGTL